MRNGQAVGTILVAASLLLLNGSVTVASAADPDSVPVTHGYVILDPTSAETTDSGTFYPSGHIPDGTLVVIRNDDGSLPGGLTVAQLELLIEAQARGDYAAIESFGFDVSGGSVAAP